MNERETYDLLSAGENERTEFKRSFSEEVIISLTAFSNTRGGTVVVGVDDHGMVTGIHLGKETMAQWINEIRTKTAPPLIPEAEVIEYAGKTIVTLTVVEYPVKPVSARGRFYRRAGNSNQLLTVSEVVNFHLKSVNSSWDFYPRAGTRLDDISIDKVQKIIEAASRRMNNTTMDDPLTFLQKFRLITDESVSHACWLLFMPGTDVFTTVEMVRFDAYGGISDSGTCKGDLFSEVEDILHFIRKNIHKRIIFNGNAENEERWDYPMEAVRELVTNMVLHRDYTSPYDSLVRIYDDHIEFFNPGALPEEISVDQLLTNRYFSMPRNKLVAEVFKTTGLIEKYGSGIKRVIGSMANYHLPAPEFESLKSGFKVTLYMGEQGKKYENRDQRLGEQLGEQLGERMGTYKMMLLNENQRHLLNLIEKNPVITLSMMSKELGISQTAVEKNVKKLKENGLIRRVGTVKKGYWENLKNERE